MRRLLVLGVAGLLAGCGNGPAERVVSADIPDLGADRVMMRPVFYITSDGVRQAVQRSDSLYMYEDSSTARLFGVDLVMYDSVGKQRAHVRSQRGRMNLVTDEMFASGNVVVMLDDQTRIETEELHYDPRTRRIWSDVETRRVWPDGGITTFGSFQTDEEFSFFKGSEMRGRAEGLRF